MLTIAFRAADEARAKQLQADISRSGLDLHTPMLLVLVTPAALQDADVQQAIANAQQGGKTILVPVILQTTDLPAALQTASAFDMTGRYRPRALVYHLRRLDVGEARVRTNNRFFVYLFVLVMLVFGAGLFGIMSGMVAFPVEEYEAENTQRARMIQELVEPTLNAWQPRTTEDALNFPMTVEAANTRNAPLLILTATALPRNRQATLDAQATAADATAAALTGTPAP